jgi:hypothetical protein
MAPAIPPSRMMSQTTCALLMTEFYPRTEATRQLWPPVELLSELLPILPEVSHGTINQPPDLRLQFIRRPAVFRKCHPAHLNGAANYLIDLTGTEELDHLFTGIALWAVASVA